MRDLPRSSCSSPPRPHDRHHPMSHCTHLAHPPDGGSACAQGCVGGVGGGPGPAQAGSGERLHSPSGQDMAPSVILMRKQPFHVYRPGLLQLGRSTRQSLRPQGRDPSSVHAGEGRWLLSPHRAPCRPCSVPCGQPAAGRRDSGPPGAAVLGRAWGAAVQQWGGCPTPRSPLGWSTEQRSAGMGDVVCVFSFPKHHRSILSGAPGPPEGPPRDPNSGLDFLSPAARTSAPTEATRALPRQQHQRLIAPQKFGHLMY